MDLAHCNLDGNADAVEFCPSYPHYNILAAATYTLQEGAEPSRSGSISLFSVDGDVGLELLQKIETAGVFDIKWKPMQASSNPVLAQAGADGCLSLYTLKPNLKIEAGGQLNGESAMRISSAMCLCLDWDPSATSISLGLSDGSVSLVILTESKLCESQSWDAHEYEVWSTSFDLHQPQLLYTGSDDCRFCCWDTRDKPLKPVFQNTKSHTMGVCCIAKNPTNSNMLLTGSYDEYLRVWDVRAASRPVNECSLNLGGGVWRIKHHPDNSDLVLTACMHNGFAILRMTDNGFTVTEKYQKHESLAYGADWKRGGYAKDGNGRGSVVATCSFYDKLVRIWQPESLVAK